MKIQCFRNKILKTTTENYGKQATQNTLYEMANITTCIYYCADVVDYIFPLCCKIYLKKKSNVIKKGENT
jgi:hypothetical protein